MAGWGGGGGGVRRREMIRITAQIARGKLQLKGVGGGTWGGGGGGGEDDPYHSAEC